MNRLGFLGRHSAVQKPLSHLLRCTSVLPAVQPIFKRRYVVPAIVTGDVVSKKEKRDFMAIFPDIVRELTAAGRNLDIPDVNKWYSKVLQYNVSGGRKTCGLTVQFAYRHLCEKNPSNLTPENIRLVQIMGWCVEMLQAFSLMYDDIMDGAESRRGRVCWHRKDGVGLKACNDAVLIEAGIYHVLRRYFQDKPYYLDCMELFHNVTLKTAMGQALDMQSASLDKFTMDRYEAIVKYKNSSSSFQMPVGLGMYMAGVTDPEMHRQAKTILLEMGNFFQVQDDYLDCFGDPELTGKVGSDIRDGKCSWLAVVALQRANSQQKKILEECYGSKDTEKEAAVKRMYSEMGLPHMYTTYEEQQHNLICTHIQQISRGLPHKMFFDLLDMIYQKNE